MGGREIGPDFEREWPEFLSELRVVLPGAQLLFAFLLAAPFSGHFDAVIGRTQGAYVLCFLTTTTALILLMAPSVYHRLHWRRDVRDKERMLRACNRLAIAGSVSLAVAVTSGVFVAMSVAAGTGFAIGTAAVAGALIGALWLALPLVRRRVERDRP